MTTYTHRRTLNLLPFIVACILLAGVITCGYTVSRNCQDNIILNSRSYQNHKHDDLGNVSDSTLLEDIQTSSGEEKRRLQEEAKARGLRNQQKRQK